MVKFDWNSLVLGYEFYVWSTEISEQEMHLRGNAWQTSKHMVNYKGNEKMGDQICSSLIIDHFFVRSSLVLSFSVWKYLQGDEEVPKNVWEGSYPINIVRQPHFKRVADITF